MPTIATPARVVKDVKAQSDYTLTSAVNQSNNA